MPKRLTRANTRPGSPERAQVYAREYTQRQERSQQLGVTYGQARKLRALFPLTPETAGELRKNHRNVGQMHTQYAVIRTQIAKAQLDEGKKPSRRQRSALRTLNEPLGNANPAAELKVWYQRAYGADYDPKAFGDTKVRVGGYQPELDRSDELTWQGEGQGWGYEPSEEELYDVDFDAGDWDLYDFGEYG